MSNMAQLAADIAAVTVHGNEIQAICHDYALAGNWWSHMTDGTLFTQSERLALVPTKLMLVVSELAEAMEAHRRGKPDNHLPERDGLEVELADALIRIYDLGGALGYDLGAAMAEKLAYNAQRADHKLSARRVAGGKAY